MAQPENETAAQDVQEQGGSAGDPEGEAPPEAASEAPEAPDAQDASADPSSDAGDAEEGVPAGDPPA